MRNTILTLAPVLLSATLSAQGVFSNKTQATLEKVIQDYPNHFYHIKGELVSQALRATQYKSTVQLPGSSSGTVILYNASHSEGYGWTCKAFEGVDFEEVRDRFKAIYGQISNCIVTTGDQKTFILSGQYEVPREEKKSTCVVFSLLPAMGEMKKLKVELRMSQEGKEWKIYLSVSDQDPKEEAQGAITVNNP
jgi:hypothetical protein